MNIVLIFILLRVFFANRAPTAFRPVVNCCLPFVALVALPPDLFVAFGGDLVRGKVAIFRGVPLGGNVRVQGPEIPAVCNALSGAVGTAAVFSGPGIDGALPFVALRAAPPDFCLAAVGYGFGRQYFVFVGMPLLQKLCFSAAGAVFGQRFAHIPCRLTAGGTEPRAQNHIISIM